MSVQERVVVNEEEESARLAAKNKRWGIFPRGGKGKDGSKDSATSAKSGAPVVTLPPAFSDKPSSGDIGEYDEDEDDGGDITATPVKSDSPATPIATDSRNASSVDLPKTAGFDFKAISNVLGKNVDPTETILKQPSTEVSTLVQERLTGHAAIERTGSAPPLDRPENKTEPSSPSEWPAPAPITKYFPSRVLESASSIFHTPSESNGFRGSSASPFGSNQDDDDDDGDIGYTAPSAQSSKTDRPPPSFALENPW